MQSQGSMVSHLWHCLREELIVLPDGLRLFKDHLCRGGNKKQMPIGCQNFITIFHKLIRNLMQVCNNEAIEKKLIAFFYSQGD